MFGRANRDYQVLASLKSAEASRAALVAISLGGVGSPMLKPPGDGFHKQRGHQVWHKLI